MTNRAATWQETVGQTMRLLRTDLGLDQPDMAEAVGLSVAAWSRHESGSVRMNIVTLHRAAKLLGQTAPEILAEAERRAAAAGLRMLYSANDAGDAELLQRAELRQLLAEAC